MIEPLESLAFAVHHNKGAFALLLGSGISRSASIPTGWDIILDLIRKLAHLRQEDCEPDPAAWYRGVFKEEPDYSGLLDAVAKSQAERTQLLRSYFEPGEEERQQGLKVPTAAHRAIDNLVASGHIQVVVTTNFDRLLEKALEQMGIVPTVISTPDAIEGALPLQHTNCTIVKVHGDYIDTRIKNTRGELEQYSEQMNGLIDRVLDEYGLIVCGWSADWDVALRAAIERCQSRRFTTYWTTRGAPSEAATTLIGLRRAEAIRIRGADEFFSDLAEKVTSLDELDRPHPLTIKTAVATLKRYLASYDDRIRLHDLVMHEVDEVVAGALGEHFRVGMNAPSTGNHLAERLRRYEALTTKLQALMVIGCYWSDEPQDYVWVRCLERIALLGSERSGGQTVYVNFRRYPALLLLYCGGIAALAGERYSTFSALLAKGTVNDTTGGRPLPYVLGINWWKVLRSAEHLPDMERHFTPASEYLWNVLRAPLRDIVPSQDSYDSLFDRYEYLQGLVHSDLYEKQRGDGEVRGPIGCFAWRDRYSRIVSESTIGQLIEREVMAMGEEWPLLKAGLFNGSLARFLDIKGKYDERVVAAAANYF